MSAIFTDIIWVGVRAVYNVLSTPLDLLGGLSIFSVIIGVFVMGIIINIVIAFVNNDFGNQNIREASHNIKSNSKSSKGAKMIDHSGNSSGYGWL